MGNATPSGAAARNLSPAWRRRLARDLEIHVSFELFHPAARVMPGADYYAKFDVTWDISAAAAADESDRQILTALAEGTEPGASQTYATAGDAHLTTASLDECWEAFDSRSADAATIGETVLNADRNDLLPELENLTPYSAITDLIVVNEVHIAEPWRGLRLGLLGTGQLLRHLSQSSLAVLQAMEPGLLDEQERARSHDRLTGYWGLLGFELFRNQIMVLDLCKTTIDQAMDALADDGE